jgi:hypothetical protein
MRKPRSELLPQAIADLRELGYSCTLPARSEFSGTSVWRIEKENEHALALIQTRSYDPKTYRYLVGIMEHRLNQVNYVVLWFEGEKRFLKIPSRFLLQIRKLPGATIRNGQWYVTVDIRNQILIPQNCGGLHFGVSEYATPRPLSHMAAAN